jgi:hypothetical protein
MPGLLLNITGLGYRKQLSGGTVTWGVPGLVRQVVFHLVT